MPTMHKGREMKSLPVDRFAGHDLRCWRASLSSRQQRINRLHQPTLHPVYRRPSAQAKSIKADSVSNYSEQLAACESSGDWLQAVELMTEVRLLKVSLPRDAWETAIGLCVTGQQGRKAVTLIQQAGQQGHEIQLDCLDSVFQCLSQAGEGTLARQLLKDAQSRQNIANLAKAYNCTVRACARGGEPRPGLELVEAMLKAEVAVQHDTYTALAKAFIAAGDGEKAYEMLEWRDYL